MEQLLWFCSILVAVVASVIPSPEEDVIEFSCSKSDQDVTCSVIQDLALDSAGSSFSAIPQLFLVNCTTDYFSPQLATQVHNATESLVILDGNVRKVYLKPTLKAFTDLRASTAEIVIDPEDNYRLELFDIEGQLRAIPDYVQHLKVLATLDLCQNRIEWFSFNQLDGLDRLRKVNLGHNQIRSVSFASEVSLPALEELFLHGNLLETLDLTNLKADRLARLYLSQNQLIRVAGGFPERYNQLQRVDLYGNEWDCEWLERTLGLLRGAGVETMSYLPGKVCDERGSVQMHEEFRCLMKV